MFSVHTTEVVWSDSLSQKALETPCRPVLIASVTQKTYLQAAYVFSTKLTWEKNGKATVVLECSIWIFFFLLFVLFFFFFGLIYISQKVRDSRCGQNRKLPKSEILQITNVSTSRLVYVREIALTSCGC